MTTNFVEVYNLLGLPLVAIVEFILYGTKRYIMDWFQAIQPFMNDSNLSFGAMVTKYMTNKATKTKLHQVVSCGSQKKEV
jgi:hypothetical protein